MILINDKIVHLEIVEEQFLCNLNACKGACCWKGDYGAPVTREEMDILDRIYPVVKPFLTKAGIDVIEKQGTSVWEDKAKEQATPLVSGGACAYMTYDELGIAKCGIEQAHKEGVVDFLKPISCHLYPIRIEKRGVMDALYYDKWDICSAACDKGKEAKLPIYKFVKNALIRKYGEEFYERLEVSRRWDTGYMRDTDLIKFLGIFERKALSVKVMTDRFIFHFKTP